jgi:hypothetical protein
MEVMKNEGMGIELYEWYGVSVVVVKEGMLASSGGRRLVILTTGEAF